jgi:phage baseplate assembly protein W
MALDNSRTASARERDRDPDSKIGLSLPITIGRNGYFKQTSNLLEQTKHNIKNLLLTVKGERLAQPDFGSEIYGVLFENFDTDFDNKLEQSIRSSVSRWLPHVIINGLIINSSPSTNFVHISIEFSVTHDPNATESVSLNLQREI